MTEKRVYEPHHRKHESPKGYGTLCHDCISLQHAQALLDEAIAEPNSTASNALYARCGEAVFVARPARLEAGIWHGYPELGSRVPPLPTPQEIAR